MSKVSVFLAPGLEEVECLAVVDVLRRGGVEVQLISIGETPEITVAPTSQPRKVIGVGQEAVTTAAPRAERALRAKLFSRPCASSA